MMKCVAIHKCEFELKSMTNETGGAVTLSGNVTDTVATLLSSSFLSSLVLSDTQVYAPWIRARLGTAAQARVSRVG